MLKLIETDTAELYNGIIQAMEVMIDEPLYPGDERRIFTEALVQVIAGIANQVNIAANGKTLQYASGDFLDALGYRMGVTRFAANPAKATFEFTLSDESASDTIIPAGTLITTDGELFFATDSDLIIAAGETTGSISGTCTTAGTVGNDFGIGAIAQLVEIIDNVESGINTTASSGGTDEEEDDDYRERIHLSNAAFSTAGSKKAYIYHAKSADPTIIDVYVVSPSACVVYVYVLTDTGIPSASLISKVQSALSADDVRPLTDQVTVKAPTAVSYNIEIKYYTTAEDEADCVATIEGTGGVIDQFKAWQSGEMGKDINPDKLLAMCLSPTKGTGAVKMDVTYPEAATVDSDEVAQCGTVTITHEVISL